MTDGERETEKSDEEEKVNDPLTRTDVEAPRTDWQPEGSKARDGD